MNFESTKQLWRRTGRQDAANAYDPNELAQDLKTKTPTASAIKSWLLKNCTPNDMKDGLEFPWDVTKRQKYELLDAWADGWAAYAAQNMKEWAEEFEGE